MYSKLCHHKFEFDIFFVPLISKYRLLQDRTSLSPPLILAWTRFFSQPWAQRIEESISDCTYHCIITDDKE